VVLDTSALLAVFFDEPEAEWVASQMATQVGRLSMSTVNLAETLILVHDRQPARASIVQRQLMNAPVRFVPPTVEHARIAADARLRFPLNLGDCFAYALAMTESEPLLTLDRNFARTDASTLLPKRKR
jgi:ribonuclease VapC